MTPDPLSVSLPVCRKTLTATLLLIVSLGGCIEIGTAREHYVYGGMEITGERTDGRLFLFTFLSWEPSKAGCQGAALVIDDAVIPLDHVRPGDLAEHGFQKHPGVPEAYLLQTSEQRPRIGGRIITIRFAGDAIQSVVYTGSNGEPFDPKQPQRELLGFVTCDGKRISLPIDEATAIDVLGAPDAKETSRIFP